MSQNKIIRLAELRKKIGLSSSTIWRKEQQGNFPKRINISSRAIGWLEKDIEDWIIKQLEKSQ